MSHLDHLDPSLMHYIPLRNNISYRSDDHRASRVLSLEDTGVFFIIAGVRESGWREEKHYQSKLTLHAKSNVILLIRFC